MMTSELPEWVDGVEVTRPSLEDIDIERYRADEERVRIMTQGGADTWMCPTCACDSSMLHFYGNPWRHQTYKSHGLRSDTLYFRIVCDHGHLFRLELRSASGALSVSVYEEKDVAKETMA